jgi:hypothetical protein
MDAMKLARMRLVLAIVLFAGWIGWLAYLVIVTRDSVVLSRPQFLVSTLDVVADIDSREGNPPPITVREVHWPTESRDLAGKTIPVENLADCKGWTGPGSYIVPLITSGKESYRVAPLPRSPGFEPDQPVIYPATPQTLEQLQGIPKPKKD